VVVRAHGHRDWVAECLMGETSLTRPRC